MRKVHKKEPIIHKNMSNHNNKLLVDPALILQEYPDVEQENTESEFGKLSQAFMAGVDRSEPSSWDFVNGN